MTRKLMWGLGVLALLVVSVWAAREWAERRGADEARLEEFRLRQQTTREQLLEAYDSLYATRAREQAYRDSVAVLTAELALRHHELSASTIATLDTAIAQVPDSVKRLLRRARAKVDSSRRVFERARTAWQWIHDSQAREILELEATLAAERADRRASDALVAELEDQVDPPWYEDLAGSLPEGVAKVAGGVAACTLPPEDARLETCAGYAAATGIDLAF